MLEIRQTHPNAMKIKPKHKQNKFQIYDLDRPLMDKTVIEFFLKVMLCQ